MCRRLFWWMGVVLAAGCAGAEANLVAGAPPSAARASGVDAATRAELLALAEVLEVTEIDGRPAVVFTGVNVHVRNGLGQTDCGSPDQPCNGLGNLIVGYHESDGRDARTGSHRVVVGARHDYAGSSGLVVGYDNAVSASHASVLAGVHHLAAGYASAVVGGSANHALGEGAVVLGGMQNTAPGDHAAICGGSGGVAHGSFSAVAGGQANAAEGAWSVVSGGTWRVAEGDDDWVAGTLFEDR